MHSLSSDISPVSPSPYRSPPTPAIAPIHLRRSPIPSKSTINKQKFRNPPHCAMLNRLTNWQKSRSNNAKLMNFNSFLESYTWVAWNCNLKTTVILFFSLLHLADLNIFLNYFTRRKPICDVNPASIAGKPLRLAEHSWPTSSNAAVWSRASEWRLSEWTRSRLGPSAKFGARESELQIWSQTLCLSFSLSIFSLYRFSLSRKQASSMQRWRNEGPWYKKMMTLFFIFISCHFLFLIRFA